MRGRSASVLLRDAESAVVRRVLRARDLSVPSTCTLLGMPIVRRHVNSAIVLGEDVTLVSRSGVAALGVSHPVVLRTLDEAAELVVGTGTGLTGTTICAARSVLIGRHTLVGSDVIIADTDFHPISSSRRSRESLPASSPEDRVTVGDNVFIGARSIVLKGTSIGNDAVIGAGSVVTGTIPAGVVAAGNPARVIRSLV